MIEKSPDDHVSTSESLFNLTTIEDPKSTKTGSYRERNNVRFFQSAIPGLS